MTEKLDKYGQKIESETTKRNREVRETLFTIFGSKKGWTNMDDVDLAARQLKLDEEGKQRLVDVLEKDGYFEEE